MLGPWRIEDDRIDKIYRGTGRKFRALMDRLIEASAGEVANDADRWIAKNVKDDHKDGGVDTQVERGWRGERSGFLRRKSVWQYSSGSWKRETAVAELRKLVRKPDLLDRLKNGYSLRLCVPEPKPARDVKAQTLALRKILASIRGVPASVVRDSAMLDGNRITQWINRHWTILREHRGDTFRNLRSLEEWASELRPATPRYVDVPEWQDARTRIRAHVDFAVLPPGAVLQVTGPAGAGKTRFVLEALAGGTGMQYLVGYLESASEALVLARQLGSEHRRAILVVDECDAAGREQLRKVVYAFLEQIRVITIDNSGEPRSTEELVLDLERMDEPRLRAVLSANFPDVPAPRLEEICSLASGFVRWGVTLCRRPTVNMPADASDYLRTEFPESQPPRRALLALSLVTHLLYGERIRTEDTADEARTLVAALFGQEYSCEDFQRDAFAIHASHGFVHRGSQVLYLTPQIFVAPLFVDAWSRLIKHRTGEFLATMQKCPVLVDRLLRRYQQLPVEARKECAGLGDCFRDEVARISAKNLTDAAAVRRLCRIVEMDPDLYLPALRERIATLDLGILRGIAGESSMFRKATDPDWGPRRYLVWLAERLASFARWFHDSAEILLRLAAAENEKRIANNATEIWRQIHRMYLSGTELSYHQRVAALRERVREASPEIALLLVQAASAAFEMRGTRRLPASPIVGLPAPAEWQPTTNDDYYACLDEAMALLAELAGHSDEARSAVRREILGNLGLVASRGLTAQARRILGDLSDEEAARARRDLADVLARRELSDLDRTAVEAWVAELTPKTLRQQVMELLHGGAFWEKTDPEAVLALARRLLDDSDLVREVIGIHPAPASGRARGLGEALGRADVAGAWLETIGRDALERGGVTLLASGYLTALAQRGAVPREFVQRLIAEPAPPQPVLSLLLLSGALDDAVDFVLAGLRANRISPATAELLEWEAEHRRIPEARFAAVIRALVEFGTPAGIGAGVFLLHAWLGMPPATETALRDPAVADAAWATAESWARLGEDGSVMRDQLEAYRWSQVMKQLLALDAPRTCELLADALVIRRGIDDVDRDLLRRATHSHGALLLDRVIEKTIASGRGSIAGGELKEILGWIPLDVLRVALDKHGVAGARVLARHLLGPSVVDGRGVMPPATRLVLERFGSDARVMSAFSAGIHTGVWARRPAGIAESHRVLAEAFLADPHPAIRKWAADELQSARDEAERWRAIEERDEVEAG